MRCQDRATWLRLPGMEYSVGGLSLRTDGDIFECLSATASDRIPLDRLIVRVDKKGKTQVRVSFSMATQPVPEEPVYAWGLQLQYLPRHNYALDTADEPGLREFFTQLAAESGRTVGADRNAGTGAGTAAAAEPKRRKLFGRS